MKENILNKLLIVCCVLSIVSCKARRQLVKTDTTAAITTITTTVTSSKPANTTAVAKLGPIRAKQVSFNTFSGKAKTSLDINGNSNDCTLNIRISNNKKIWVSITAILGIEIARAQITPDSIKVINRLQGIYLKKPFNYIYSYANKQVNYAMLQALLVGNAIPSLLNDSTEYEEVNNNINLSGNLQDLMYKLVLGNDYKVTQTNLSNDKEGQSLQVNYASFMAANGQKIPAQIAISSTANKNDFKVNMHYVKVDFNQPQDYPFNIPGDYTAEK